VLGACAGLFSPKPRPRVSQLPTRTVSLHRRNRVAMEREVHFGTGRVAHSEPKGMGIAFVTIETGGLAVLDNWIAGVRANRDVRSEWCYASAAHDFRGHFRGSPSKT